MGGLGRIFKRGKKGNLWIAYYVHGREFRESAHTTSENMARRLLQRRLLEVATGQYSGRVQERLYFDELWAGLERDYKNNGMRSIRMLAIRLAHLKPFFGMMRAVDITASKIEDYKHLRKGEQASNASINRELALLRRAFNLAVEQGRLNVKPRIRMLEEDNARQGFFEHGDFLRLRDALVDYLQLPIAFLYLSGWRVDEMRKLRWSDVDLNAPSILLPRERSKNKQPRVLALAGELLSVIEQAAADRRPDCPFVFHRGRHPVGDFSRSWKNALVAADLAGRIPHDFRRTAIRNMVRAGVPERVAMEIAGHKTREVFERYNIVSEVDLRIAQEKLTAYLDDQPKRGKVRRLTRW